MKLGRGVWPSVCRKHAANPYLFGLKVIEKLNFLAENALLGNNPNKDLMDLILLNFSWLY